MVDRKLLLDDKAQLEQAITGYEIAERDNALISVNERVWPKGLTKAIIHILEYLCRRA